MMREMVKGNILRAIIAILAIVALDQGSKALVVQSLLEGEVIPIIEGFFNLTLAYNKGAAFGFLASISNDNLRQGLLWSATAIAVIAVIFMFLFEFGKDKLGQVALSFVLGGAGGNMIDRARQGKVVDFLDFYVSTYHWPAFNVADSAICIGVVMLLLRSSSVARENDKARKKKTTTESDAKSVGTVPTSKLDGTLP
jgi:signal peptidase II